MAKRAQGNDIVLSQVLLVAETEPPSV